MMMPVLGSYCIGNWFLLDFLISWINLSLDRNSPSCLWSLLSHSFIVFIWFILSGVIGIVLWKRFWDTTCLLRQVVRVESSVPSIHFNRATSFRRKGGQAVSFYAQTILAAANGYLEAIIQMLDGCLFSEPSSSPVGVFYHVGRSDLAIPAFANGDPLLSYGFIDLFIWKNALAGRFTFF